MLIHVIPSPYYGANAMVILPDTAEEPVRALVVDPSFGVTGRLREIIDEAGAVVAGVLLTHGHPDHVWECAEVASWGVPPAGAMDTLGGAPGGAPVWLPAPDRYRMANPAGAVSNMPTGLDLPQWREPEDLRDMPGGAVELVPGLVMKMVPAPGHTEGSAVFIAHSPVVIGSAGQTLFSSGRDAVPWALSGDVIFAGSVGRTDLPGGDETQMRHSLRTLANALDPATLLVPGHGPMTTMADEIATNPYIARARRIG